MQWIIRLYSLVLLAYTGWRTFDFMGSQLPKDDLSFWLSIIFLFATEVGLLLWQELSLSHATTEEQEDIAKWMTWIDFAGSLGAGIADMILRQTLIQYEVPVWLGQFLIYGLPLVVGMNVAAVLLYQWNDADAQIEREKRQTKFLIYKAALQDLRAARKEIASDKKSMIYNELREDIVGQIDRRHSRKNTISPAAVKATGDNAEARQDTEPNPIITDTKTETNEDFLDRIESVIRGRGANGTNPTKRRQG
jgi:hypothetical protein